ncbi:MAG: murein biosynthesis integral membrane protein MurJ, partial [Alphaproteobacteria bacterium]|nr:murein biosynthesis integral membrane protein MurJ [Alphaproteobacteria bacterium]
TPNVKRLLVLAVPAAVTGGITQINQLIGQAIASTKEGAISALQYADRIYQLPLGVVGVAVAVVLLPELARALKGGHMKEAGTLQNRSIEFVLFLTLPAAAAIWVLSDEIIRVLYERGAFSEQNTAVVASILAIYGIGLPGFVLIKALQPGYYAREDTKTPMRFTMVSVALNTGLAVTLFPIFEESGIAIAEAAAGWTNTVLLFSVLLWRGHLVFEWSLVTRTVRLMIASAIMAALLVYLSHRWSSWLSPESPLFDQVLALGALVVVAMPVYFGIAFLIGGADIGMIRRNLKRRKKAADEAETTPSAPDQQ